MTREQAHHRGVELQELGWNFFILGKKPFQTYSAEKDGVTIKGSSTTVLIGKVNAHINIDNLVNAAENVESK